MKLCSENHDEVCFDGGKCPVCEKQKEIERLEGLAEVLNDEIRDLQSN